MARQIEMLNKPACWNATSKSLIMFVGCSYISCPWGLFFSKLKNH